MLEQGAGRSQKQGFFIVIIWLLYLVSVGVVEEGSGEDANVEEDAEDIRDAEHGNEMCEELFELEVS